VAASQIRRFDAGALYSALDARRVSRGLSWRQLVDELWEQSSELNARRDDHPIAVAMVTGIKQRGKTSAQHALFMLRWLGQPPEAFLGYSGELPARWALPEAGADSRLRWNFKRLYSALDEKRRAEQLTWAHLASKLHCTPSQLTPSAPPNSG
jgi:hypothetical protein